MVAVDHVQSVPGCQPRYVADRTGSVEITVTVSSLASSLAVSANDGAVASSNELVSKDRWNFWGAAEAMSGVSGGSPLSLALALGVGTASKAG